MFKLYGDNNKWWDLTCTKRNMRVTLLFLCGGGGHPSPSLKTIAIFHLVGSIHIGIESSMLCYAVLRCATLCYLPKY